MFTRFNRAEKQLQLLDENTVFDPSVLFDTAYHHLHKSTSNKTMSWFATDQPDRLNKNYDSSATINYKFNQHGYRCDELVNADILFIGCSYTFGVGLPLEDIWAYKIAEHFNVPYINLAFPGGSPSYILRTILKTYSYIRPKIVVALLPFNYRFEFLSSDHDYLKVWSKGGSPSCDFSSKDSERIFAYEQFSTQKNEEFELLKTVYSINSFLKSNGSRFFWNCWEYDAKPSQSFDDEKKSDCFGAYIDTEIFNRHIRYLNLSEKARDSTHPSCKYHQLFYELVKNRLYVQT